MTTRSTRAWFTLPVSGHNVSVVPLIYGVVGAAAGTIAVAKEAHWRGAMVVTLNTNAAVARYYWASLT